LQDLNIFDYGPKQWKVQNDNKILKVVNWETRQKTSWVTAKHVEFSTLKKTN
jgi:hypothetical protein